MSKTCLRKRKGFGALSGLRQEQGNSCFWWCRPLRRAGNGAFGESASSWITGQGGIRWDSVDRKG